jgi:predicted GNAT superfamily acetyltransferase
VNFVSYPVLLLRYLYDQLFQRAKAAGADFVGLDVFNRNSASWSFHEQALSFHPEVQLYNKILEN